MASLTTYSPRDVICTIAGIHTVEGYSNDTFIQVRKNEQTVITKRAMDGSVARLYGPDDGWNLELSIMQSSSTNDILSALYNVDQVTQRGKFPITIKDSLGTSLFVAGSCWIERPADFTFAADLSVNTWTIKCTDTAINIGGSGSIGLAGALGLGASALPLLSSFGII